jgi:hypothetical protein
MGIRARFTLVIVGIAVAVAAASYITLNRSHAQLIEQEAVRIAEIVAIQVVSDRAEYTQNLVGKLSSDGTGAAVNSQDRAGFSSFRPSSSGTCRRGLPTPQAASTPIHSSANGI